MNNLEDKIIETENGGIDEIISEVSYDLTITTNVEQLELVGSNAINGNGNNLDNLLKEQDGGKTANSFDGKAGNDIFSCEGGNDTIIGGEGNDIIDGGDGSDTVIFTGAYENYDIRHNPDTEGVDQIFVKYVGNERNGEIDEGEDELTNVEWLVFANGETHNTRDITESSSSAALILTGIENL